MTSLYLVFSTPPLGLPLDEYVQWYAAHVEEALGVRGLQWARRYKVATVAGESPPSGFAYLSMYGMAGDPGEVIARLEATEPRFTPLPTGYGPIQFASWICRPLDTSSEPSYRADELLLEFASGLRGPSARRFSRECDSHLEVAHRADRLPAVRYICEPVGAAARAGLLTGNLAVREAHAGRVLQRRRLAWTSRAKHRERQTTSHTDTVQVRCSALGPLAEGAS